MHSPISYKYTSSNPSNRLISITLILIWILLFLLWHTPLLANPSGLVRLSGMVADKHSGYPLPGATLQARVSGNATVTDINGYFVLEFAAGDTVEVKFLGYKPQRTGAILNDHRLNILLEEDNTVLYEVLVTGALGIRRAARETGGGTQVVNNEQLNQGNPLNPVTGLASKVAGLRINIYDSKVDPEIRIIMRGSRSLNRSANSPLYVVDGITVPDISRLNPNDIESITILKGANAAALYGSEGVNGALMISTKKGGSGKQTLSLSHTTGISRVFLLPEAQTRFGQGQNGIYNPLQHESWGPAFDGTKRPFGNALPDGTVPTLLYETPTKDNRLGLFQTGRNQQSDFSMSGGTANNAYFLSLQHSGIEGILPGDQSRRTGVRYNASKQAGLLTADFSVNYINYSKSLAPDGPWLSTYTSPANIDFAAMRNWKDPMLPGHPLNYFTDQVKNPFFLLDNYRQERDQQVVNGKLQFDLKIHPMLHATYRMGVYTDHTETRNTTGKFETTGLRERNCWTNCRRRNSPHPATRTGRISFSKQ